MDMKKRMDKIYYKFFKNNSTENWNYLTKKEFYVL